MLMTPPPSSSGARLNTNWNTSAAPASGTQTLAGHIIERADSADWLGGANSEQALNLHRAVTALAFPLCGILSVDSSDEALQPYLCALREITPMLDRARQKPADKTVNTKISLPLPNPLKEIASRDDYMGFSSVELLSELGAIEKYIRHASFTQEIYTCGKREVLLHLQARFTDLNSIPPNSRVSVSTAFERCGGNLDSILDHFPELAGHQALAHLKNRQYASRLDASGALAQWADALAERVADARKNGAQIHHKLVKSIPPSPLDTGSMLEQAIRQPQEPGKPAGDAVSIEKQVSEMLSAQYANWAKLGRGRIKCDLSGINTLGSNDKWHFNITHLPHSTLLEMEATLKYELELAVGGIAALDARQGQINEQLASLPGRLRELQFSEQYIAAIMNGRLHVLFSVCEFDLSRIADAYPTVMDSPPIKEAVKTGFIHSMLVPFQELANIRKTKASLCSSGAEKLLQLLDIQERLHNGTGKFIVTPAADEVADPESAIRQLILAGTFTNALNHAHRNIQTNRDQIVVSRHALMEFQQAIPAQTSSGVR
ncbi:hypothetical protein FNU76_16295 [Chitinimonas arctica]|uniref:Uncharacterized protein n=1 Tax=Chitinimonas arctica TaxID=2594795 RepID=A0A516SI12_9NEIS|nr:hypothetical protein [Chitinimonas arctica]QDQ27780.1 hypothetical protein FNU76_16295 [Chitinimonas arctica]